MLIRVLIIVAFIVIGVAAFSQLNPSANQAMQPLGNGLSALRTWFNESFSSEPGPGEEKQSSGTKVYKWKDQDGNWQFSNQPPPEGISSSIKVYRSDTNITQAHKSEPPAVAATPPASAELPATSGGPLMPITNPDRVKQLMDDAKNIQNLVDQRQQTIDQGMPER